MVPYEKPLKKLNFVHFDALKKYKKYVFSCWLAQTFRNFTSGQHSYFLFLAIISK